MRTLQLLPLLFSALLPIVRAASEDEPTNVGFLWFLRIWVGLLNLFCIAEYLLYLFFVYMCMVFTFRLMTALRDRLMVCLIFFIVNLLSLTVIPMYVMYFPTALYGLEAPGNGGLTGAAFFPPAIVTASMVLILATFVLFQLFPFLASCYMIAKYGVKPNRKKVVAPSASGKDHFGIPIDDDRHSEFSGSGFGTNSRWKSRDTLLYERLCDPKMCPTVLIVMPIYNEDPDALFAAVLSVTRANFLKSCMHLFVSFDDEAVSELYLKLLDKMGVFHRAAKYSSGAKEAGATLGRLGKVQPLRVEEQFKDMKMVMEDGSVAYDIPTQFTVMFEGMYITISRFPHNGKRATQAKTFKMMNKMYGKKGSNTERTYVLYIDSDIILDENAIYEFCRGLELQPEKNAYTGYITCRTSVAPWNFLVAYQDAEYLQSQLIHRSFEAILGGVVCLPGALTMVRLRALKEVAPHYFTRLDTEKTLDYHRFHLGEDRYMTHLLMEVATNKPKQRARRLRERRRQESGRGDSSRMYSKPTNAFTIGFNPAARCKTEAPDTYQKLMKQRRRWFLGAVANEIFMLISPGLWFHTPFLMFAKLWDFGCRSMIFYVTLFNVFLNYLVFPNLLGVENTYTEQTGAEETVTSDTVSGANTTSVAVNATITGVVRLLTRRAESNEPGSGTPSLDIFKVLFPQAANDSESFVSVLVPTLIFVGPMLIKWLVLIYIGVILNRLRMWILFPIVSILQPAFGMAFTIYALRTYAVRSWGGPRTDGVGDDDAMSALRHAWQMVNVERHDPDYASEPDIDDIDDGFSYPQSSGRKYGGTGGQGSSGTMESDGRKGFFSLRFVNLKMLDEDDTNTMYQKTMDRFGTMHSQISSIGTIRSRFAQGSGVLQRPSVALITGGLEQSLTRSEPAYNQDGDRFLAVPEAALGGHQHQHQYQQQNHQYNRGDHHHSLIASMDPRVSPTVDVAFRADHAAAASAATRTVAFRDNVVQKNPNQQEFGSSDSYKVIFNPNPAHNMQQQQQRQHQQQQPQQIEASYQQSPQLPQMFTSNAPSMDPAMQYQHQYQHQEQQRPSLEQHQQQHEPLESLGSFGSLGFPWAKPPQEPTPPPQPKRLNISAATAASNSPQIGSAGLMQSQQQSPYAHQAMTPMMSPPLLPYERGSPFISAAATPPLQHAQMVQSQQAMTGRVQMQQVQQVVVQKPAGYQEFQQ